MHIANKNCGWIISMDNGRVQRIEVDYRLGLLFSDESGDASLYIGNACHIRSQGNNDLLNPGEATTLAPALGLFDAEVEGVDIDTCGRLTVRFTDGRILDVSPSDEYEAWELGCSLGEGWLFVCAPGGEVTVFNRPSKP